MPNVHKHFLKTVPVRRWVCGQTWVKKLLVSLVLLTDPKNKNNISTEISRKYTLPPYLTTLPSLLIIKQASLGRSPYHRGIPITFCSRSYFVETQKHSFCSKHFETILKCANLYATIRTHVYFIYLLIFSGKCMRMV